MKMIDLTGQKFGMLSVIEKDESYKNETYWKCICDCGNIVNVRSTRLRNGRSKSCGCSKGKMISEAVTKHGMSRTKLYNVWNTMRMRCYNPKSISYKNYGGRGITVCDEWKNSSKAFCDWAIKNGYKEGLSIDRINVNGNYEPDNCQWITHKEQANNTRNNHFIEYNGECHTRSEWAAITGISAETLKMREARGWSTERLLTEPVSEGK